MSEQVIIDSDILIEIFNKGCNGIDCEKCPFNGLISYCKRVEL